MLRERTVIGVIVIWKTRVEPFTDKQVALVETFADQAVIAVENVRLLKELNARTAALTRSVGELKALGEVGQAVSSTLDLGTVLSTIVARATAAERGRGGSIYEYDEVRQEFLLHSADGVPDDLLDALRKTPMRPGEGALGRMAITGQPVEIRDVVDERVYQSRVRDLLVKHGLHSMLVVPLLREDHLLGGLVINRKAPGAFDPQVVELLKTFAAQSAIAIENARLFREIEIKSRELESASRHKSEFLANMSHELRTPLNAIIGFSDVLSERLFGELNAKQAEYVTDIADSGRHLLALINDILDLSKIEAGRMELDAWRRRPPQDDRADAVARARARASAAAIALTSTVAGGVGIVRADERKVKQVLLNLLSNALKFTPEGGRIDVRAAAFDDRIEISVTDTGVGIAPEDQDAVFEEFRQVGRIRSARGRHRARPRDLAQVHRAARRAPVASERSRQRLHVHLLAPPEPPLARVVLEFPVPHGHPELPVPGLLPNVDPERTARILGRLHRPRAQSHVAGLPGRHARHQRHAQARVSRALGRGRAGRRNVRHGSRRAPVRDRDARPS